MGANLIQSLQNIRDFRAAQGRRYPLWLILLLVIMGTLSGCRGYQALEDFGVRHYQVLSEKLGLTVNRLPSDTTRTPHLAPTRFSFVSAELCAMGASAISICNKMCG